MTVGDGFPVPKRSEHDSTPSSGTGCRPGIDNLGAGPAGKPSSKIILSERSESKDLRTDLFVMFTIVRGSFDSLQNLTIFPGRSG